MSCCGIKETVARIKADAVGNPIIEEADFVMVEYIAGNQQKHQVGSPTQVLRREYGFQKNHYGQHKYGDVFAIHRDDLKKAPKRFKEVKLLTDEVAEPEPPKKDKKPEGSESPTGGTSEDAKTAESDVDPSAKETTETAKATEEKVNPEPKADAPSIPPADKPANKTGGTTTNKNK